MPTTIVVTLTAGAVSRGAKWCVEGYTEWKASGASYTFPSAGDYVIQYLPVEGYKSPADVDITSGVGAAAVAITGTYSGDVWLATWSPPVSICLFKGQVICGGAKHIAPEASVSDARIVRWSEIGAFRFLGATANPLRNEAGEYYIGTSNLDAVMKVLPLKKGVIVYGHYSITTLIPVSQPAPAFAVEHTLPIGIANPLAVAGNEKNHLFVDTTGELWLLYLGDNNVVMTKDLGYSDIFGPMQEGLSLATGVGVISIVYNESLSEFYISNGLCSYLYNDLGLTRIDKAITSCIDASGSLTSAGLNTLLSDNLLGAATVVESGDYAYFRTDIVDFNMSAIKTILSVEVAGAIGTTGVAEVMVEWRNNSSEDFRQTAWKRCSPNGIASPIVSGRDLRICYRVTPWTDVQVNAVTVEWQLSDKTSVRGNYTNVSSLTAKSGQ